jgi:uncharacterized membrane protein YhhN
LVSVECGLRRMYHHGCGIAAFLGLPHLQAMLGTDAPSLNELVPKFGPSLAGVLAIALLAGRSGLADLWRRLRRWRMPVRLYVAAILLQPAIVGGGLLRQGPVVQP